MHAMRRMRVWVFYELSKTGSEGGGGERREGGLTHATTSRRCVRSNPLHKQSRFYADKEAPDHVMTTIAGPPRREKKRWR